MATHRSFSQAPSRRQALQLSTLGATGLLLGLGGARSARADAGGRADLQLSLPPYPFFSNLQSVMTEDRALLDRLLRAYGHDTPAAAQDPIDFLARYVPVYVFERTLRPTDDDDDSLGSLLWLMHLAGYFGGVWLRTAFVRAGVPRGAFPVSAASFNAVVARSSAALAAFAGSDAGALAFAEASLRGGNLQGLTDSFGYNAGYLAQILGGARPTAVSAPAGYFTYNPAALLAASYGVPTIDPLDKWRRRAEDAARRPGSRYAAIVTGTGGADALPAIQAAGFGRGQFVWAPGNAFGLNIAGFDQATYDLLLVTSAYFLQCVQAAGLAALASSAVANADWARGAVRAFAMTVPYGGSYGVGLFDGAGQLPTFT